MTKDTDNSLSQSKHERASHDWFNLFLLLIGWESGGRFLNWNYFRYSSDNSSNASLKVSSCLTWTLETTFHVYFALCSTIPVEVINGGQALSLSRILWGSFSGLTKAIWKKIHPGYIKPLDYDFGWEIGFYKAWKCSGFHMSINDQHYGVTETNSVKVIHQSELQSRTCNRQ